MERQGSNKAGERFEEIHQASSCKCLTLPSLTREMDTDACRVSICRVTAVGRRLHKPLAEVRPPAEHRLKNSSDKLHRRLLCWICRLIRSAPLKAVCVSCSAAPLRRCLSIYLFQRSFIFSCLDTSYSHYSHITICFPLDMIAARFIQAMNAGTGG